MKHQPLLRLGRLAVLGVLCLASCQVAKEVNVVDHVSYDLTVEASLPATRTANEGMSTKWVGNDMLSVLHAEAGKTQFYGSAFTYSGEENTFKGRVLDVSTVNDWYLLYPYREDNVDAKQMHINVANVTVQTGNDNMAHIAGEGIPLWGRALNVERSTSLNVTMQNVLAIQRFAVSNTTMSPIVVKEVSMAVPSTVTGSYVGDLTANEVEWVPEGASSQNVTVTVEDGAQIPAGEVGHFYAATVPFTFKAGEKMNIHVVAVHPSNPNQEIHYYFVRTNSSDVTFTPGHITPIPAAFDENHQTQDPDAPTVKKNQTLYFASESITWTLGDVYAKNGIYNLPMTVVGAQTSPVTYISDTPSVAEITSEGKVLIKDTGYTFIKAIAPENDEYNSAEASFKLIIAEEAVTPSTTRTYTYVAPNNITVEANSNSAGTFLITGVESSPAELSVAKFPQKETGNWSSSQGQVTNGEFIPHKVLDGVSTTANSITTDDAEVIASEVELISSGNGWKFKAKGNGQYLAAPSQNYRISFTNESSAGVFTISGGSSSQWGGTGSNGATVMTGSYYFYHSGSADGFTLRTNSTTNTRFYKLENSKQNQTLSFGDVTWTLGDGYESGGTYTFPQAQGAQTLVRYTSDNSSVAEIVDATSNRVKINGTGTAHITATADETTSYYGATATMTITIKPASTPPVTGSAYVKVTGEPSSWDGTYLFVQEDSNNNPTSGKAFAAFSANASSYAVNVTISNGQIAATSDLAKYALTVTDAGVQHANASGQEAYDVRNSDGKYIFYSSSTIQIADSHTRNSADYYHAFKYVSASNNNPAGVQVLSSGHSNGYNKYYLGYASSAFGYSQSADSRRVQLYKLSGEGGGTNPDDPGTDPEPGTNTTYTKVTSLTAGGTYVITDIKDAKLFKGASDGSYVSVSPANGVITDATNSFAGYEFTVEQSGSNYYLKFSDGKYLVCDYGSTGNTSTGLRYVNSQSNVQYPYSLTIRNGAFEFYTTQISNTSNTNETLYFKESSDLFKIGQSGVNVGVHLYLKTTSGGGTTPSKQDQTFRFSQSTENWTLGNGYSTGTSYPMQSISGTTYGALTYSSSDTSVATISNGQITIRKAGSTTISVTAAGNDTYNSRTASYLLVISESTTPTTGTAYVKASSLTAGGTYLITDIKDAKLFKGASDGSYVSVSPANGVITDATNSFAGYEFTVEQSGSNYYLKFSDGKYLVCDYGSTGNTSTGLRYVNSQSNVQYPYSLTIRNGAFEFYTTQISSTSQNQETLYFKESSDLFKIGQSGVNVGVHIYLKESSGSGKQAQSLRFGTSLETYAYEQSELPKTVTRQTVQNSHGTVTYRSDNTNVATVSGNNVTLVGFGEARIYADATGDDNWYAASEYYTINVRRSSQVGVFNLENEAIHDYLDDVEAYYTTDNRTKSRVTTYAKNVSSSNRLDWPSPVTVEWTNTSTSGNKTVYVYNDAAHTDQVDYVKPVSVSGSSNTAEIYNLIPGHTYYYVVRSGSTQVASGDFSTTGRRRMMKIGSDYGQNYANNCRDLGGQVTISGKTIKYGRIYRGSNMDGGNSWFGSGGLSDEAKETILVYMKIGLDVDLRAGDRNNALNGTRLNNVTYSFPDIEAYHPTDNDPTKIVDNLDLYQGHTNESYSGTGDLNNRTNMKATLTRIMTAVVNGLNVYVHCMVGADRTGYTCMMLEAILGVPLERCDMDYEMTSFSCVGTRSRSGDSVNYYHSGVSLLDGRLSNTNTYQEKAVDYATNSSNGLGIPMSLITAFQNAMLE